VAHVARGCRQQEVARFRTSAPGSRRAFDRSRRRKKQPKEGKSQEGRREERPVTALEERPVAALEERPPMAAAAICSGGTTREERFRGGVGPEASVSGKWAKN
jgi:hypothetical protein